MYCIKVKTFITANLKIDTVDTSIESIVSIELHYQLGQLYLYLRFILDPCLQASESCKVKSPSHLNIE